MIFVTDLWLEESTLSKVANDERLKNKFLVFNHHEYVIERNLKQYSFTTIRVSEEKGLCSGTSLFYEWLINSGFINKNNKKIAKFSELTRKYDTWEWKTKYDDEIPHELTLLFNSVGSEAYIRLMFEKLSVDDGTNFLFSELERMLIDNKIKQVQEKLDNYVQNIYYHEILGFKAGIVFIDYEYRNDITDYFRQNNFDMDFTMLISLDSGTISFRSIKNDVNVRLIAEAMGGSGHDKAAGCSITEEKKRELIKAIIGK